MKCNHILQHKKLILFFFRRGGAYIQLEQNELVVDFFILIISLPKDFMSGCDSYFPRMAESIKNLRGLNVLKYLKRARDAILGMQGVILL